ncbi:unnamed protein product [Clonostachys byssicola]|uniref:Zn(2)-C6 fungal-type domain-containing protein n=1 Tax=Clonostachys byssicola TaxID=160290 RepID=A0A9N9UJX3_9HYPO|nr:unnamed protein product [Clonostachys byssicola]
MTRSNAPAAEEDANSGISYEEGSSGDDTAHNVPSATTPRKRKREKHQKTSCELCKARKVKCDRAEPACSWCARHNRTCVYLERQKPGSRIGFGLELEAKVNKIDALLQSLGRRLEEHIDSHDAPSPAISTQATGSQVADVASRGGFSSGVPAPNTPAGGTPNSQGTASLFPGGFWPGSDAPDVAQYGGQQNPSGAVQNTSAPPLPLNPSVSFRQPPLATPALADLPPQDVIYTLVDLYFKHCNTWCPILERKTTFGIFFGSTSMNEADRVLLHAIVATTLRFLKDPRLSYEAKLHYHGVSRRTVQLYAMENVSIEALKVSVILSLDELGTLNGPRGWNLLAMLAQNARQLGLCEETSVFLATEPDEMPTTGSIRRIATTRPESWIEDEGRRRLCWMVYLLDRYATIATTTFDFSLSDSLMRRVLPCSYDLFSRNVPVETQTVMASNDQQPSQEASFMVKKPENLGSFAYHCEILRIISKIHNFLRTPVDVTSSTDMATWRNTYHTLDSSLDSWLQSLPSEYSKISALCHSDPASRVANWFMLHSAYVVAVVRLHSAAAYPTVRSHIFVPSHYAMQRCLSAVQSLGDIARDVYEADGLDLLGPPFAFSLWVAARLLIVHAATVGGPVDPKIEFLVETLKHVGQYWEVAHNYAKVLSRVIQRARQNNMSFAAMRKSAYDLVQLTTQTRRSGLESTSTQNTSLSELDNIDVFDFFNLPRVSNSTIGSTDNQTNLLLPQGTSNVNNSGGIPDPESDWLRYNATYH